MNNKSTILLWLSTTSILQAIKLPFMGILGIVFLLTTAFYYISNFIDRMQRIINIHVYRLIKIVLDKKKEEQKRVKIDPVIHDNEKIVGKTRTEFISELPVRSSVTPYLSEPLEREKTDYYEDSDIDSDDVESRSLKEIMEEEEPDIFSNEGDMPSELSSGVTIEELAETYDILSSKEVSEDRNKKAAETLKNIEGNEVFEFFMVQKECQEKAKRLMEDKNPNDKYSKINHEDITTNESNKDYLKYL